MLKKKTAFRLFNEYDELREGRITIPKYVEIFRVLEKEDEKAHLRDTGGSRRHQ